jgi:hypothetical protein
MAGSDRRDNIRTTWQAKRMKSAGTVARGATGAVAITVAITMGRMRLSTARSRSLNDPLLNVR